MIFPLLKLIIWLAGIGVIVYFFLPYFGYEMSVQYWNERKVICQESFSQCRTSILKNGWDGAKESCRISCLDPKLLIKKK
ncbi:MAG TPA: hypothetical protein VJH89_02685 [Patescibacteria group bacterium]|nr:hypothetical protein [Patescibacteria group bacterium]